jgi:transcriptional regulator GlxA family with amidase domain
MSRRICSSGGGLDDTIRLLARELAHPEMATSVVLKSVVDILLVQLLRAWRAQQTSTTTDSWLGALSDPIVGAALARVHDDPGRPWTNATLARAIPVPSATLTRRFHAALSETPAAYLTRWRMDLAAVRLRDTNDPLDVIAAAVGSSSVYAFSRAFSRARGESPGRYRSRSRASALAPPG